MRISDWSSDVCSSDLKHEGDDEQAGIEMPAPDRAIERNAMAVGHPLPFPSEARANAGGDRAAFNGIKDRRRRRHRDRRTDVADRLLAGDVADIDEGVDSVRDPRPAGYADPRPARSADLVGNIGQRAVRQPSGAP